MSDLLAEGADILALAHWREIALDHDKVPLDIDWDQYLAREKAATYKVFVCRRDGMIIGYAPFDFFYPARYNSTLYVQDDTIYVVPEEKNRFRIWLMMLERAVAELPKPCKLCIRLRPQHGGDRIMPIIEKRLGIRLSELMLTGYLE